MVQHAIFGEALHQYLPTRRRARPCVGHAGVVTWFGGEGGAQLLGHLLVRIQKMPGSVYFFRSQGNGLEFSHSVLVPDERVNHDAYLLHDFFQRGADPPA